MILPDVNILINAHRPEMQNYQICNAWLEKILNNSDAQFGMADLIFSSFIRLVTNPKIFKTPTPLKDAFIFLNQIREHPRCFLINPGSKHWEIFKNLCHKTNSKGPIISDIYFAALAIESNCEWVTLDRDFARIPGLKWSFPKN